MIILASASPRRQELLRQINCDFQVVVSNAVEDNRQNIPPDTLVVHNAIAKARAACRQGVEGIVLGADTVVALNGRIYGKPLNGKDAMRMLSELAGKAHEVYTGIALVKGEEVYFDVEKTVVKLAEMTQAEIASYVDTKESMDKAGAYAIQGIAAVFVERIEGCYTNVVGLPLNKLLKLSRKAGINLS